MIKTIILALALFGASSTDAYAGQPCPERPLQRGAEPRTLKLATKVRDQLEQSGATLAFIGRAGIDLREWGLVYSHVGLAWRDHPKGRWYTFHLLNPCGTAQSELVDQPLEDFYEVELVSYDALVAVPSDETQLKLLRTFFSPLAPTLHHPIYSMIANPFSTRYQNSNQWVLEVTAAALAPENSIQNRLQAQNWLKANGFEPTTVHIGAGLRLTSSLFSAHVHFDDHTAQEANSQKYNVVTVDAIVALLKRHDPRLVQHHLKAE